MRVLFVHQNFPAQFKHLAPALAAAGHDVRAFAMKTAPASDWHGVAVLPYYPSRGSTPGIHPWVGDFETKVIRGEAVMRHALKLRDGGYSPDVMVAHPGWGESLFLKDVWPRARLALYSEFHYSADSSDLDFDPEFPTERDTASARMRMKNLMNLLDFQVADAAISPTRWQADTFPAVMRERITVVHDGIDTRTVAPNPQAGILLAGKVRLTREDEVVTFVNRTLEPYRGYHVFMRSLPELLSARPSARVLIVGAESGGYGSKPPAGQSWRQIFLDEVRPRLTQDQLARIFFLGQLPYEHYLQVLQVSSVHVYLTYPFVLSWSLIEAMSTGCAVVASDVAPVREVIRHGENGRLVPFFEPDVLAADVAALLADPGERARLGANARACAVAGYDLRTVCLPRQLEWVESLVR